MTPSQDRLDRIEALLEASIAQHNREMADMRAAQGQSAEETQALHRQEMAEFWAGLRETKAITESNARAIEAWSSRITDSEDASRAMSTSTDQRLETAIADTVAMIADMGRQQQETDQRFEIFLQEARADRQRFDQAMAVNAAEHRAFTQNVQVLLAEIARLWQRVAG
ncbi:MAG: hypothetical protein ACOYM4_02410 [Nodosilinea sp.]